MTDKVVNASTPLRKRVTLMVMSLLLQFVLGMVVNLYGVSPDDPTYKTESILIKLSFLVHGINGLFLVVGAVVVYIFSVKSGNIVWKKTGLYGLLSILLAAGAGIATLLLKEDAAEAASFVMAIGFILSFVSYGRYYFLLQQKS